MELRFHTAKELFFSRLAFRTSLGRLVFEVLFSIGASECVVHLYLNEVRQPENGTLES